MPSRREDRRPLLLGEALGAILAAVCPGVASMRSRALLLMAALAIPGLSALLGRNFSPLAGDERTDEALEPVARDQPAGSEPQTADELAGVGHDPARPNVDVSGLQPRTIYRLFTRCSSTPKTPGKGRTTA